ncbi:DNA-binding transcriptional regulator, AcrR family [Friedmanniella luteola]|uniref:DNA-binding transcriptional regulator, AcrR family n=1 Tax=Friedmanniella luteola TaxID=546871 RepID=A0A1H1SYD8_9ACTN|nr:TetR/AcrR family transcriptional regulator [Friedmanniella luteola]SDS52924.1 DNA-binding transcriptional regulator, AcrR family [Friedmanniella luteola]
MITRKGQATRERIVDAAATLIGQFGVAGTSADDIRKTAGVSGSQLMHYFGSKQALVRAVIVRQSESEASVGHPMLGPLDSFRALRGWADAAVENLAHGSGHGACTLAMLAGSTSPGDEQTRDELCSAFVRLQSRLLEGLRAMRDRGDLRPEADLDELSMALLTALQGGTLLGQAMQSSTPMRASLNAALHHVESFAA